MTVKLDDSKCSGCSECVEVCPSEALSMDGGKVKIAEDECTDCGACVDVCPNQALTLD